MVQRRHTFTSQPPGCGLLCIRVFGLNVLYCRDVDTFCGHGFGPWSSRVRAGGERARRVAPDEVDGWLCRRLRASLVKGSQHRVRVGDIVESERQGSASRKRIHSGVGVIPGRRVAENGAAAPGRR